MDWSPLITVASSLAGLGVGSLAGWFGVQGKIMQNNAQARADIIAAQNAVAVRQKIGQIAAGAIEQTNKDAPPEVKQRLAMELAQTLSVQAATPSTDAQMLPNVLAGVAALPATNQVPATPTAPTIDEMAKG